MTPHDELTDEQFAHLAHAQGFDSAMDAKRAWVARQNLAQLNAVEAANGPAPEVPAERRARLIERSMLVVWLALLTTLAALAVAGVTNWYLTGPGVLVAVWRLAKTFE